MAQSILERDGHRWETNSVFDSEEKLDPAGATRVLILAGGDTALQRATGRPFASRSSPRAPRTL